ncbi:MAG: T9SS type A sorting domain-containing protein [Prolixibacteraceae bacterium]|jgi:hypothetical protein|nr:T9SS type A sorting domain-containing protein [Prolixibacteraceae bacterium]MBT6763631.1 T9SS type A sorting domain-containing protein [Prolixibacteraceae bacterium]MBT6998500.1 T9SS type A sorting domain-containing protein [Prolixibacteraceae bacterium]MBT7397141.1 T9SS type A sorting domain-containing protein [Prolixibacteraceae bacterium]
MSNVSFIKVQLKFPILIFILFFLVVNENAIGENSNLDDEIQLNFSYKRELYNQPFELRITSNNSVANIFYTLDCSMPSEENGIVYSGSIQIDSTIVVKAIAITSNESSAVYTHTYVFPAVSAKQGINPQGFPELWGGAKIIDADYEMDPEVINHPDYANEITNAFESLPSLSLTMDVDEWFNHETGLYVGYPNTNVIREKPVTAEFLFNNTEENFAIECGVQNQGGSSIVRWKSPKQSMRLLFKEIYGPTRLRYKLFHDSEINSINTLVVDVMLNATWIHPTDVKQRLHAMYLRDQLTSDLHNEMGSLSVHGRYFHLYLNGLYWGICNLHERPDDAFLSEYLDAEREDFDIVKHGPDEIVSGTNDFYLLMLERARDGFSTNTSLEDFQQYVDLPAFIDYMILNFYLGNYDWARHNFYAGRNRLSSTGFRFYTWDSEHVMRFLNVDYDNTGKNDEGAPTEIHTMLKENEEYRIMFADAVYKNLFNDGALTPENFEKNFLFRKNEIEVAIILESARWGDYRESVSDTTYTKNEFWIPEVNKALEEYIPQRRDIVIDQFRGSKNKLFPDFMPPVIEIDAQSTESKKIIKLINPNSNDGDIYFTVDGSDPRKVGGDIQGIKYTEPIEIENSSMLKARFYTAGEKWSALAENLFLFDDIYGDKLTINEIMYHPEDDYPEFIEIMNFGESSINMDGFTFTEGINYTFTNPEIIQPGAGVVLSNDNLLFNKIYNFNAFGQYEKQLSNSGEAVILKNGYNQLVDSVAYSDTIPWPVDADGAGYSLELANPNLDNALWSSWKASEKIYGSPYATIDVLDIDAGIYPNPFYDKITIKINTEVLSTEVLQIDVFNQLGSKVRTIESTSNNSQIEINLGGVLPGMYFIRIDASKTTQFNGAVLKAIKLK